MARLRHEKLSLDTLSNARPQSASNHHETATAPFPSLPPYHPANDQYTEADVDPNDENEDDDSSIGQDDELIMMATGRRSFRADSEIDRLREQLHHRGTSIKFDSVTHTDDGNVHTLEEPLPKPDQLELLGSESNRHPRSPTHAIPIRQRQRRHSEAEKEEFDLRTGEPLSDANRAGRGTRGPKYHQGEMRYPLVQSTVDELAREPRYGEPSMLGELPSLKSDRTASSPGADGMRSTSSSALVSSPLIASPSSFWPQGQQSSTLPSRRSVSQRSFGSIGSVGRRHVAKSVTSSLASPARSFLSQWTSRDEAAKEPDPDDEGQEIGDGSGYIIGRRIGYGGFSIVKEVTSIENDKRVIRAVKIVRKQIKDKTDQENERLQADFEREVDVWRYLKHPYILPLIAVYDTSFATYCVTKLNSGGTLFDLVRARRKAASQNGGPRGLPAKLAKRYIYQLGSAIRYLHEDVRAVHRDIKPENCLLDMSGPNADTEGGNVLLCDFGMADFVHNEHRATDGIDGHAGNEDGSTTHDPRQNGHVTNIGPSMTSTNIQGSLEYTAPELFAVTQPIYSTAADMWAFGCVAYTLLTGAMPFMHEFQPRLVLMIQKGAFDLSILRDCLAVHESGSAAVNFVQGCLALRPEERFSISQALEHDWLDGCRELYEPLEF
jgi:serine/threonine protein kinase